MSVRNALTGLIASVVLAGIASCGGGDDDGAPPAPAATVVRSASLTGAQENPPVISAATGRGAVIVNTTTREITGGITFTGLIPSPGGHHIHQAPSGNPSGNGPVIVGLVLAPDNTTATVGRL